MDDCLTLSSISKIIPAYTYKTELCQQIFIHNGEGQYTSYTSFFLVLELQQFIQSHVDDNLAMITLIADSVSLSCSSGLKEFKISPL